MKPTQTHTPGPWIYCNGYILTRMDNPRRDRCGSFIQRQGGMEANGCHFPVDEQEANAHLMAAAPELLAVVQRFARYCEQNSVPELQGIACDAFAAIARATAQP